MKKTIIIISLLTILALSSVANEWEDDNIMTIQEFSLLSDETLTNYSTEIINTTIIHDTKYYIYEMNKYVDFEEYNNETGEVTIKIVPARLTEYYTCYELDCEEEYDLFINEYKNWTLQYYNDLKEELG